jgi:hypothetical protein
MVTLDRQRPIVVDRVKEFAARLTKGREDVRENTASSPARSEQTAPGHQQGQGRGSAN